jgi:hypothetical protein
MCIHHTKVNLMKSENFILRKLREHLISHVNPLKNGFKRFVFISSICPNGAEIFLQSFIPDAEVRPHSPYAMFN